MNNLTVDGMKLLSKQMRWSGEESRGRKKSRGKRGRQREGVGREGRPRGEKVGLWREWRRMIRVATRARQKTRKRSAESSRRPRSEIHKGGTEKRREKASGEKRKGRRQLGEKFQNREEM